MDTKAAVAHLLDRKVLFVGGKGGVGKTTTAASLSLLSSGRGKKTLVVSTDPAHSLGDSFGEDIGPQEKPLANNLWGLEINPDQESEAYIEQVKRNMRDLVLPEMYRKVDEQMDLAKLSPGTSEAALLERVATLMTEGPNTYDIVIFDTAPTGHTIRLLTLPEIMAAWTDSLLKQQEQSEKLSKVIANLSTGKTLHHDLSVIDAPQDTSGEKRAKDVRSILLERQRKFMRARRMMLDTAQTGFILVLNPERLPIQESKKAMALLANFNVQIAAIVVNRVLPPEATGDFLESRRQREVGYRQEIEEAFGGMPIIALPLFPRDVQGRQDLQEVGQLLAS